MNPPAALIAAPPMPIWRRALAVALPFSVPLAFIAAFVYVGMTGGAGRPHRRTHARHYHYTR